VQKILPAREFRAGRTFAKAVPAEAAFQDRI
jgi:hypothetical protein